MTHIRLRLTIVGDENTTRPESFRAIEFFVMNNSAEHRLRLLPDVSFPPYTYVPGSGTPHPISSPEGHQYDHDNLADHEPLRLDPSEWAVNAEFLTAIDLFNHGYYWEAHEAWEGLWIGSGRTTTVALFLKGLIKLAAAGVKVREGNSRGVARHAQRAQQLFAQVQQEHGSPCLCGFDLTELQSHSATAAQTQCTEQPTTPPGSAVTVFPFVLSPSVPRPSGSGQSDPRR